MAKQNKFNMAQLLNAASIKEAETGKQEEAGIETEPGQESILKIEYLDVNDLIPAEENFYNTNDIEDLKASIELTGVKQNLIVKALDTGKYKVIAGHRRRLACLALVAEGKTEFEKVPAQVMRNIDSTKEELMLLMTNSTARQLTDYEKTKQAQRLSELLVEVKKKENIPGRVRELAAEVLKTTTAQIGRYESINKNLEEDLMAEYETGAISVTVAYEASKMEKEGQDKVLSRLKENGTLSIKDVKKIKEDLPLHGQTMLQLEEGNTTVPEKQFVKHSIPEKQSQAEKQNEVIFLEVLSESEISDIEKNNKHLSQLQRCDDFHVIPNDKKKTVSIIPQINGAFLELSKDKATALAAIIQDCIKSW
ncbi:MAG: ParB N-terminal domain-containing protein [Lachnospiraceae bacterium]|nr:ParB N-terminal domain-containing protein [Lachnospiraceae bacterium]